MRIILGYDKVIEVLNGRNLLKYCFYYINYQPSYQKSIPLTYKSRENNHTISQNYLYYWHNIWKRYKGFDY